MIYYLYKVSQYRRGRAPDVVSRVVELNHSQGRAKTLAGTRANIAALKQKLQRHFEHLGDLGAVGDRAKLRRNKADNRRDEKPRTGQYLLHTAGDRNQIGPQPYLLGGLSDGRRHGTIVRRLDAPTRKADLPRMIGEVRRTLGEDHLQAGWPLDQRQQYGSRSR